MRYDDWKTRAPDPGTVPDRPDDADGCPWCASIEGEGHQPWCPLFAPSCACGARARRYLSGVPVCASCAMALKEQTYARR